jgi:hypothetical protein
LADFGEIATGSKSPRGDFLRNARRRDVMDKAFPSVELLDLCSIDIEPDDRHTFSAKLEA